MTTQAELGHNRTGTATSPDLTERMLEATEEFPPDTKGDERLIGLVREDYAKDAEALGSVPPPKNVAAALKMAAQGLRGLRPTQFIDKLGERLAFERTGTRLYEALLTKHAAYGSFADGPERAELEAMMRQEYAHFSLLVECVIEAGGDPTVVTPSADLHATISKGVLEVLVDPRTTLAQCLEAILVAELADYEGWETLVDLAENAGEIELARRFSAARDEEDDHLDRVRCWIAAAQDRSE